MKRIITDAKTAIGIQRLRWQRFIMKRDIESFSKTPTGLIKINMHHGWKAIYLRQPDVITVPMTYSPEDLVDLLNSWLRVGPPSSDF